LASARQRNQQHRGAPQTPVLGQFEFSSPLTTTSSHFHAEYVFRNVIATMPYARRINALSSNDIFRSQFRAAKDAEKSQMEIIKWGLEHLDRLRKARAEARDASAKAWQIWLVFGVGLTGIIMQIVVALLKK
jgi:hypothetical protein